MSYGSAIAVHPTDPNIVICGGVDLHLTKNGGATWRVASHVGRRPRDATYAHADHHALVMPASSPGRIYSANDGGVDRQRRRRRDLEQSQRRLCAVTMFYDIDSPRPTGLLFGGGAQDNGTLITTDGHADTFFELLGGDGGWMVVDPQRRHPHLRHVPIWRHVPGPRNWHADDVSPPFKDEDMKGVWMVYTTFDPNDSNTVYTGNQRVYRTKNDGQSWAALTPVLDGSPISAIEVAPADTTTVYVGTENGGVFRTLRRRHDVERQPVGSGTARSDDHAHRDESEPTPVTCSSPWRTSATHTCSARRTADRHGLDIDNGKLPDVPHHALLIRPDKSTELYVCNDVGVFLTKNNGSTWTNATANLPNVMVVDLVFNDIDEAAFRCHLRPQHLETAAHVRTMGKAGRGRGDG